VTITCKKQGDTNVRERLQQILAEEMSKPDGDDDEMVRRVEAYHRYIQELEGEKDFGVTGYQMLIKLRREAKRRQTVISITTINGEAWVVTETNQRTKQPRQLGVAAVELFEALQSAGDFNTDY
jgi:uncharacterized protein YlzI (FlbEa/FlbD family)